MTLPASGHISIGQVAAELGIPLPLELGDSRVRALAGKPSGPISLGDLYGKSAVTPLNATGYGDSGFANSSNSGGTVSCAPSVAAGGGTGTITYLWEIVANVNGCVLTNATSATCLISHTFAKGAIGTASATLRCTVRDGVGAVVVLNNIPASLDWESNL